MTFIRKKTNTLGKEKSADILYVPVYKSSNAGQIISPPVTSQLSP